MGSSELTIGGGSAFLAKFGSEPPGSDGGIALRLNVIALIVSHNSQLRLNVIGCIHRETDGEAELIAMQTKKHFSAASRTELKKGFGALEQKWEKFVTGV